mgnify:CR=1 FL=1
MEPVVFSELGERMSRSTGIGELMEDLGHALALDPDMRMLGGGNPAIVPEFMKVAKGRLEAMLRESETMDALLGKYDPPRGHPGFVEAFAGLLRRTYGWPVGAENVAVTSGSQCATFFLVNLLAGRGRDGKSKKILLPLSPEYLGYADQAGCIHCLQAPHGMGGWGTRARF